MALNEVIRKAVEAEMLEYSDGAYADHGCAKDQLEHFAAFVAATEREACARVCDEEAKRAYKNDGLDDGYEAGKSIAAKNCAAAIRART